MELILIARLVAQSVLRDTSPIDINDIDTSNITHIENESSPDLVNDFVSQLDFMVSASNLKDRI